jgi:hypothetical protein
MKPSERSFSETRLRHIESVIARHLREVFRRLPMLAGFCLRRDFRVAELSVLPWPGDDPGPELYGLVMESLVELAEEHPEALRLMCGRTFARTVH